MALVSDDAGRLSLAAVNLPAEAAGLEPGLPLAEARALLPGLITVPHDPAADARALAALAAWCARYTPWAAPDLTGPDSTGEDEGRGAGGGAGVLLDVSGCCHLFGGEHALLENLQARLAGLGYTARAALADTIGCAWAMARFATSAGHPCVVVLPGRQRAALAPLPPAALRLPPATVELMDRLGLRRVEDLYNLTPSVMTPRFGTLAVRRLGQAVGTEAEALSPRQPPAAHLTRRIFAEPLSDPEDIARAVGLLLDHLCRELARAGRGARQLELTAYRSDGSLQRLSLGASRPSRDAKHLRRLFTEKLPQIDPGFGIEVMTLGATLTATLAAQQGELRRVEERAANTADGAQTLPELVDRLGSRLGLEAVRAPRLRESHLPERAFALASPVGDPAGGERAPEKTPEKPPKKAGGKAGGKANDDWQKTPHPKLRPLRLLARPEPVDAVSLLPDYPPAQFRWRRVLHQVVRAEGPERLLGEWWRTEPEESDAPPRDYFRVEDEDGRRYWLYRAAGRWFLHGLFG
ncbi:DNA polymerase Y family protein [Pelagibius sp. CAU 1746]|uniref:DinB/UmuC family translesion DNA polymerase n=1 Tax=Pelagibius sp. CAU 1746 TaxID=3140370 RepID=UPI00325B5E6A